MKTVVVLVAVSLIAMSAAAARTEHGSVLTPTFGLAGLGLHTGTVLINSIESGVIPNGLYYYAIHGVTSGGSWTVVADDGQEPFVVGTADECPGPDTFEPTNPDWWLNDFWVYCSNHPDFDVYCGDHVSLPGDEEDIADCESLYVYLSFGDFGEGFTYTET